MTPSTPATHSSAIPPNHPGHAVAPALQAALELAGELAARYGISALSGLLNSSRAALQQDEITVAVLGRFKAGKSSFLNHFIGRDLLPVGVVPVTAAVTEMRYGARPRATVHHLDGSSQEISLDQVAAFISEKENPENARQVRLITIDLPELGRFHGLKFVDTPGLESALAHNTRASLDWLPQAGLALVAVSVDPPLSQRDIDLLNSLYQHTSKVAILLTKADLLGEAELAEVVEFVHSQLTRNFPAVPPVFPYSIRPGFERHRQALETACILETLEGFDAERHSILTRKMDTLLQECADYLALSLKSAEMIQSEREALKRQVVGEKELLDDAKSQLHLLIQHAAAGTRAMVSQHLEARQDELQRELLREFAGRFPRWTSSLAAMLSSFEEWLGENLRDRLAALSVDERAAFLEPFHTVRRQSWRALQQFRERLSDRTMRAFGVPLRTTETEIGVAEPAGPDIRIGRVFDRNWELLSPVLPVFAIRSLVRRHFERTTSYLVYQNLSRLAAQWEESLHAALRAVEAEARRRLDELIFTVEGLVDHGTSQRVPEVRADLDRIDSTRRAFHREQA